MNSDAKGEGKRKKLLAVATSILFGALICWMFVQLYNHVEEERTNGHDSVSVATKMVQDHPDDPDALASLGNAWYDQGHYDLAIVNHVKSLRLDPRRADTHAELGDDYIRLGKQDNARAEWQKALLLDGGNHPSEAGRHAREMLKAHP